MAGAESFVSAFSVILGDVYVSRPENVRGEPKRLSWSCRYVRREVDGRVNVERPGHPAGVPVLRAAIDRKGIRQRIEPLAIRLC